MRLKLEKYYRISIVVSISILIINVMILLFIGRYWGPFYFSATVLESLQLLFISWTASRLLSIKTREQNRVWRRPASFVVTEKLQSDANDNDEISFRKSSMNASKIRKTSSVLFGSNYGPKVNHSSTIRTNTPDKKFVEQFSKTSGGSQYISKRPQSVKLHEM